MSARRTPSAPDFDLDYKDSTPGFGGNDFRAPRSIQAKTLVLAGEGDLCNPEANAFEAAQYVPDARCVKIRRGPRSSTRRARGRPRLRTRCRTGDRRVLDIVTDRGRTQQ